MKKFCMVLSLITILPLSAVSNNTIMWRSFSSYLSRNMLFEAMKVKNDFVDKRQIFSVTVDYMQNFGKQNSCNLGAQAFWSGSNVLTVGNNDGDADFDAYQLGLGEVKRDSDGKTILGSVECNPKIQQVGADITLYFVKSEQNPGWYLTLSAPLGAMLVQSNFKEVDPIQLEKNLGWEQVTDDPMSSTINYQFRKYPTPEGRPNSFVDAFVGGSCDSSKLDGTMLDLVRLRKGRMINNRREVVRVADIAVSFGYNFIQREKGFFGAGIKVSGPTGNVPNADYIFEPIFGRAGMWGIGGELKGKYEVWNNERGTFVDMLVQAEGLHVCSGRNNQYRSFDLKNNGMGSKYLLLQYYRPDYDRPMSSGYIASDERIPDYIQPAINLTTLPVKSKFAIEGSVAVLCNVHHNNWRAGIGAEFWGRSREALSIDVDSAIDLRLPNLNDFAVLGRQLSSYQIDEQFMGVNTYYCEPLAQINKSQEPVTLVGMTTSVAAPSSVPSGIKDARISANRIPSNLDDALDICGAQAQRAYNGKLVGHVGYVFEDRIYKPSVALQLGVELTENKIGALPYMWNIACKGSIEF